MDTSKVHVAVVGAGPAGLAAIKSLMEEGFQVTGFEQRSRPGGLWAFSENPSITSVTSQTRAQLSKFLTPFSDYPHPNDFSRHPSAAELCAYYGDYARHFSLSDKIHFNTSVNSIKRDEAAAKWLLHLNGHEEHPLAFDRVVYAVGTETKANRPVIDGIEMFTGRFTHGQGYKRPQEFEGCNVLIVGQGNSAADCAVEITSCADKVYLAHRRGCMIMPRMVEGKRFDRFASWKMTRLAFWLGRYFPAVHRWMMYNVFSSTMLKAWGEIEPQYRFDHNPYYSTNVAAMMVNDDLIPALRNDRIESVSGIKRIIGEKSVELDDGTVLDNVDAIVACVGYHTPFEPLGEAIRFSRPHPSCPPQPDLFQNVFALDYPDSLAFLNYIVLYDSAAACRELAAVAVAQVWASKSSLPSRRVMQAQIESRHSWYVQKCINEPVRQLEGLVDADSWLRFMHDKAGTGVYDHFGWTLKGLWFSLRHPLLYLTMAYGVNTPHINRYFDTGKRKWWSGAEAAIWNINELSKRDLASSPDMKSD